MIGSKLDIFKKEWLDVVFDGRNKTYGAYDLRKLSPRATNIGLFSASVAFVLLLMSPAIARWIGIDLGGSEPTEQIIETEVVLSEPPPVNEEEPPPPPPVEPPPPRVDQVRMPEPKVVPAEQVQDEEPPTVEQLKLADPGSKTIEGDPNAEIRIDLPVGEGEIDAEVTESSSDQIFQSVEINPEPPGGLKSFMEWVGKNYDYPQAAIEAGVNGQVQISFVVERDGSLTDIRVVRDLKYGTGEAALKLLQKAPKWSPGIQNGRPVRVAYTLPIRLNLQQ
ncbi:energy transducer TonB [Parapedobacter koreensis]|uniref:Outer membrane transport energization protein TonB n=1 Tax=Parapedobacter koreensis TaxID=332977 RepID=A0A1H7QV03_9SPHI|nr:energy transducer TonB [Parapedobacter koreensis]SEL51742.1 outer membrane transport energization protein TonB [Parapedobacter koreensis]